MHLKVISLIIVFLCAFSTVTGETDICADYLSTIVNKNPNAVQWALKFLDASAKLPAGILSGNLIDLGAFDECIGIDQLINQTRIRGKYCLVAVAFDKEIATQERAIVALTTGKLAITLGWCIPDVCSITTFTEALHLLFNYTKLPAKVLPLAECQTEETVNEEWTGGDWTTIGFLIFILAIVVASTAYDTYIHYAKQEPAHIILLAFSIKSNGQKLLSVSHNSDQLLCLHGIRFISMLWVILGHSFTVSVMGPIINFWDVLDWEKKTSSMYIIGATVSVDTFFLLSGILACYMFLLAKEKGINFNILLYYIHRYIRLTPALAILVWIHATILRHFGSGPYWPLSLPILEDVCQKYWWSALLYIQNYVNNEEMCIGQTWYLSVDMQLFILSPLILVPLWRYPKATVIASVGLVFGSFVSSFVVTWYYDLPGLSIADTNNTGYMTKYYYQVYTRYGPWLIGILLGHLIYVHKRNESSRMKLNPIIVCVGWIISLAVLAIIVFAPHDLLEHSTTLKSAFFNGLHRQCWALGVSWIIYACIFGYGGPINTFLSWSVFQVLGRFTYTMYLIHMSVQTITMTSSRSNGYFADMHSMHTFWGDFFFALFLSVCLTLGFESPMLIIEKVIFKTDKKKRKEELPSHHPQSVNGVAEASSSNRGHVNKAFNHN